MRPLQDQCYPTPLPKLDDMLRKDMQMSMDDLFSDFDPEPIGVASVRPRSSPHRKALANLPYS